MKCLYSHKCNKYTSECNDNFQDCSIYRKQANLDVQKIIERDKETRMLGIGASTEPPNSREEFKPMRNLWDNREIG